MKFKSAFSLLVSLALAAFTLLAANTCSAAILVKPKASKDIEGKIVVTWSKYKGAKRYTVYRSISKRNIKYAKVVKKSTTSRKFVEKNPKLWRYYYWIVPRVKNATKNLYSSSQSKKCARGWCFAQIDFTYDTYYRSINMRRGKKAKIGMLAYRKKSSSAGMTLSKAGIKWKIKWSGVHKWHKKSGKKGMLGYFTSSKKGTGYYQIKVGDDKWLKKCKIVWK
ncbi:MAG: hypothetical protein IKE55_03070 [Kiritimatiellae bacterium]|nr:hypothetical protein [Kiritimatiellia bacterium]